MGGGGPGRRPGPPPVISAACWPRGVLTV